MPTGNLPSAAKALYEKVYQAAKKEYNGDEERAAKTAWAAVKKQYKKVGDKWVKKENANLEQFSFAIKKLSLADDGVYRWRADTSDTEIDSFGDKMSQELYADFLDRIERGEVAPEEYTSDFWKGGLPYLSLSHYPDANGNAVPGKVESVFVDGKFLKAKGTFDKSPLGEACWQTIRSEFDKELDEKVRISIAFLDYKHKHLSEASNGFVFERKSLDDICPMCVAEMFTGGGGKEFLAGQLVHFALTRVPVNKRTLMEVDRSMTTKLEDAASIVGEELAMQIDEEVKKLSVGKAALTIKSDAGEQVLEIDLPILAELKANIDEILHILNMSKDKKKKEMYDEDGDMVDDDTGEEDTPKKKDMKKKSETEEVEELEQTDDIHVLASAVKANSEAMQQAVVALAEGLGTVKQSVDILIAQNAETPNLSVPQPVGIKADLRPPAPPRDPSKPMSVADYIAMNTGVRITNQ